MSLNVSCLPRSKSERMRLGKKDDSDTTERDKDWEFQVRWVSRTRCPRESCEEGKRCNVMRDNISLCVNFRFDIVFLLLPMVSSLSEDPFSPLNVQRSYFTKDVLFFPRLSSSIFHLLSRRNPLILSSLTFYSFLSFLRCHRLFVRLQLISLFHRRSSRWEMRWLLVVCMSDLCHIHLSFSRHGIKVIESAEKWINVRGKRSQKGRRDEKQHS